MSKYLHVNRKNKDALFRFIFGNEKHKEYALHLYNYLNHTEYENADELKVVTLEDVMYLNYKNDVAVLLNSVLNLWEEQSTWNPNMPYRMFLYFASELEEYVRMTDQNVYGTKPIHIPVSRSYVFYSGKRQDAKKYYEHTRREGYEEGIQIGVEKKTEEMIQSMYKAGISIGKIAEIAKCSEEEVRTILHHDE